MAATGVLRQMTGQRPPDLVEPAVARVAGFMAERLAPHEAPAVV